MAEPSLIPAANIRTLPPQRHLYVIIALIPLCCLAFLLYIYIFPKMVARGDYAIIYASLAILALVFVLSLVGYFVSLRGLRRLEDTSQADLMPFVFFIKAYVLVALIPLVCISILFLLYTIPELIAEGEFTILYATLAVVALSFLLSLLGYFLTKRDILGTLESLQSSRARMNQLVLLSASLAEIGHLDEVYERIVQGARQLLNTAGAYLFVPAAKGWTLKAEAGFTWGGFTPDNQALLETMRERAWASREISCFDGEPMRAAHFRQASGRIQVLAVPLKFQDEPRGLVLLVHRIAGGGRFTATDLDLSGSLGHQCAISLANAGFHETQINYFTHTIELLVQSMEGSFVPRRHLHNVAHYAGIISRNLKLDEAERRRIHFAALLHDIGMVKIPPDVKSVPEHYQRHPAIGAEMVGRIILWNDLVPIIRHHHENFDGTGYPDRLAGEAIPLSARIVAIGESFDAITNPESYRTALDFDNALDELKRGAGTRYDPKLVEIFAGQVREFDPR